MCARTVHGTARFRRRVPVPVIGFLPFDTVPDSRYSRGMMTAAGVVTLAIMVVGVVGNLLTVVVLMRNSKIRTVAAAFIGR